MLRSLVADPADLEMLDGVLATVCERRKIEDQEDREECARELMALFKSGVTSREDLLHRMGIIR